MSKQAITITLSEETLDRVKGYREGKEGTLSSTIEDLIVNGLNAVEGQQNNMGSEIRELVALAKRMIVTAQQDGII